MNRRPQLEAITVLRFFAAAHVVLFHFARQYVTDAPPMLRNFVGAGNVGVNFFFLLSGFVLVYTYLHNQQMRGTLRDFWVARVARLYPVYLLALLLGLPFFLKEAWRVFSDGGPLWPYVTAAFTAPVFLQAWVPQSSCLWNCPGWSLSNEMFFYALFPLLLPVLTRLRLQGAVVAAVALLLVIWGIPAAYLALNPDQLADPTVPAKGAVWMAAVGSHPLSHLAEFALGMLLGVGALRWMPAERFAAWAPWALGIGFFAALLVLLNSSAIPFSFLEHGVLTPAFMVIILGAYWLGDRYNTALRRSGLVFLGGASYALYLLHLPLWRAAEAVAPTKMQESVWFMIAVALMATAISGVVFKHFEEPMRVKVRSRAARRRVPPSVTT